MLFPESSLFWFVMVQTQKREGMPLAYARLFLLCGCFLKKRFGVLQQLCVSFLA